MEKIKKILKNFIAKIRKNIENSLRKFRKIFKLC